MRFLHSAACWDYFSAMEKGALVSRYGRQKGTETGGFLQSFMNVL